MPHEPTPAELEKLRDAIFARRKIEAIKLYREFSGCDLKTAKDFIDDLSADLQSRHPEKFVAKKGGCSVAALLFFTIFLTFFFFWFHGNSAEQISATRMASLQEALDSKQDLWGLTAIQQSNGPTYEFFEKLLPPLRYVNAAFRHYPIVLSAPGAPMKARLISNGSAINAFARLNTWKDTGIPVTFLVGSKSEVFGNDLGRLTGPRYKKGYLPIVQLRYEADGNSYNQETFAATEPPLAAHGIVFVRFAREGKNHSKISVHVDSTNELSAAAGTIRLADGSAFLWFGKDWKWNAAARALESSSRKAELAIATSPVSASDAALPSDWFDFAAQKKRCISEWESLLSRAMRVEVPEPRVNAAWKSTLINSFILLKGNRMNYSAGNQYEVMYEAESGDNVRALLLWNLRDEARRMIPPLLDYGTNPGLRFHDAAFKLQLLAQFYFLSRDARFIREQRPRWIQCVEVLSRERDLATGLLPKENYCGDEFDKVFSLNSNANAWRGLRDMAAVLDDIGETDEANQIFKTAEKLRTATLAATEKSERSDVQPSFLPIALFGQEQPYDVLTATRRGSYWNLMIPYVIGSQIFSGTERETAMLRYLEEHGGICMGMIRFHQHSGLFANEDGLDDLYGLRYVEALLKRDEVDRALVSFYGKLAQGMTRDTFLSAEGTGLRPLDEFGRPMYLPPTCSGNALFLTQLRSMLVHDYDLNNDGKPETLRLLFATPKPWLENGKEIRIANAPTAFGNISVRVQSQLTRKTILAEIELPQRRLPEKTFLKLRVPNGWKVVSAKAKGKILQADDNGVFDISGFTGTFKLSATVKPL